MLPSLRRCLRLWFTFEERVTRRAYLASGLSLAALKYAVDAALVWHATGKVWSLLDYLSPASSIMATRARIVTDELVPVLVLWSLPFMWIGVSMTMRRALDAGRSAWLALLFFVPGVNYVLMAAMSMLPSRVPTQPPAHARRPHEPALPSALLAILAGVVIGCGMLALSVYGLQRYGVALFLGTPFVVGAVTAWLFNRRYPASGRETQQVVLMTLACIGGLALLSAAEGAICLLMAAPLAIAIGAMGAILGRYIALHDRSLANAMLAVIALPITATLDGGVDPATPLHEVRSAIEIDAPPEVVWRSVIAFPPLPAPSELAFRAGIAYPMRAEIVGSGVGAVRRCVFSTGPFVEPITVWEPGRRLAFDVAEQPRPMHEWSPYADIAPPHLDGYIRSRRGEFRLIALPGGRTRLEGSTWYEMRLAPAPYWMLFGDALIHSIHGRVLRHVRTTAEQGSRSGA